MARVVAVQHIGEPALAEQLAFQFRDDRGLAGGAQAGEPDDAAGLAAQVHALFRRDLAMGPENVFALRFAHVRLPFPSESAAGKTVQPENRAPGNFPVFRGPAAA